MALFNNAFPATYQPYYQAAYHNPIIPNQGASQQQTNSGLIWVQGEAGAKSYLVAPNTTIALWDSEKQVVYLKSADASGMPSIKTLDYTIRAAESESAASKDDRDDYISKDDLNAVKDDLAALRSDVDKMRHAKVKLTRISEDDDDE